MSGEILQHLITGLANVDISVAVICGLALLFVFLLVKANNSKKLNWTDLLTRDGTKVSTTKMLQLIGGVVATWIVIKVTLNNALTWDLFAIYLAYVASIDGFSKLIMAKYGVSGSDDSAAPYKKPDSE